MKFLFKEGHTRNGKLFLDSFDAAADMLFEESLYSISSLIKRYDVGKIPDTNYYYIFKKHGDNCIDPSEIEASITKILKGNVEDVANWDTFTLGMQDESLENDIFWDVVNDIVIAKGKNNLRQICIEIAWHGYSPFEATSLGAETQEKQEEYLSNFNIPILVKINELNNNNSKQES